ncbi:cation:proton antiporter [Effusibacillus pohliae]|uniref:cation:proton antiporter n=1 Tax=Effusibacillus pohliae TaxID=232270 RepID=UPI00037655A5|nr:sodium:proton antiporter [Effusibacillus pohliae]
MESTAVLEVHKVFWIIAIVFVTGMFSGKLAQHLKIPDVAIYILAGVLAGPLLHIILLPAESTADQFIVTLGAALILFDGGRAISFQVLKHVWPTILLLAVPGVVITAAVTAAAAMYLLKLPIIYAWLLAAIIASTDPATLIPVFRQVPIDERIKQTVESESAFNDATGSILTFTVLGLAMGTQTFSLADSVAEFFRSALGGVVVGLVAGWLTALFMSETRFGFFREYPAVAYTASAIASYAIADQLHLSGFMATFVSGVILGNHHSLRLPVNDEKLNAVGHFYEGITLMMRMLIFVLLGTQVNFATLAAYLYPGLAVIAVFMLLARPLTVLACTLPDRKAKWKWNEIAFMFWVRETGVIPAALLGILAGTGIAHLDAIAAVTFLAILITIVLQASTTGWVARKLGVLAENQPGPGGSA